ncbi:ion transporter [Psychromonas ossibalaenae]|uniref:ion transporter n=1 Tax=Psychromonas ossibalaenae TaxID=444922 RepID=UPI00036A3197|nr:ion transporter [Psychromonas ossibalaenae]
MSQKAFLWSLLHDTDSRYGRIFAFVIQSLILISLVTFSMDTLPDLSQTTIFVLKRIEIITVIIFTLEYALRIYAADKKFSYIFSFYGIVDLAAIVPFYFIPGVDLRSVRIVRLLRLLRILKLFKYSKALNRLHRAFILVKEELLLFGFVALIMFYLSAVGIYYFEHSVQPDLFKSIFHSLWWALTTLTTVGYGDMFPITVGGKVFTFFVLLVGLGIVAVPTGLIATALSQTRLQEPLKQDDPVNNHAAVLTEHEFHHGNFPVYKPQGNENWRSFKIKEGIANVLYQPAHKNTLAPSGQQGSGKLTGKWLYNEQPDKQEKLLQSSMELFMDSSLESNASVGLHAHLDTEEIYYLLEGQLFIELVGNKGQISRQTINPGDTHLILAGESHFIQAGEQGARFIVVAAKVPLTEDLELD